MMLRLMVSALVAFMTLPTVVVIAVSFNPTAILSFPPAGFSWRWYVNVLTYPQFQRAALNSLLVTGGAVALALPIGTLAALSSLFILVTFLLVWLADRYLGLGRVFLQH
jgi:putative spermidine/putrescine transport system permease protein